MGTITFNEELIRKLGIVANKDKNELIALELITKGMEIQKAIDASKQIATNSA